MELTHSCSSAQLMTVVGDHDEKTKPVVAQSVIAPADIDCEDAHFLKINTRSYYYCGKIEKIQKAKYRKINNEPR